MGFTKKRVIGSYGCFVFVGMSWRFSENAILFFYVSLCENVCFPRRKRTFPDRETYVFLTGNIKIARGKCFYGKVFFVL